MKRSFLASVLLVSLSLGASPSQAPPRHQDVDHIENIEVDQTQVIITTSKEGPAEHLKIHIELVDIEENKKVNPVDLSGLWLTITRGRYTIPFLRPDTWYGVRFRSENLVDGNSMIHEEEKLIKTKPREDNLGMAISNFIAPPGLYPQSESSPAEMKKEEQKEDEQTDPIAVKLHRKLDGVENFESVYVTTSWRSHLERSNQTVGVVKLRVICDNSETKEEVKLKGDEDSVTIEITMDQKYDIETMDSEKHQIKAHITPLKCHKICWKSSLVLSSQFGDFTKHLGDDCQEISGTTSTTFLRNLKKVSVIENEMSINELIVETEVAEKSEYGTISIILQKLGGNVTEEPFRKTFDTTTSNGRFVVPLDDDAIYAVTYNYLKTKPFHYTAKTHFLAESPSANSSRPTFPLINLSAVPTTFNYKKDKPDSVLKPEPPFLLLSRSAHYSQNDVIVKIEPFCGEKEQKVRIDSRNPQFQVDAVPFLCSLESKMYFCNQNSTYPKCDPTFCFSTAVLIGLDVYDSETRCLNATGQFPALVSSSPSPIHLSLFTLCVSAIYTLFC